jgi:two-component system, LytTR family, sensor histidine kinase AlgZ
LAAAPEIGDKQTQAYLPDFCAAGTILVILLVAELVAILLTLVSYAPGAFLTELSMMSMFVLWLALLGAGVLCLIRPWAERQGSTRAFVICFLVLEVMCLVLAEIAWELTGIFGEFVIIGDTHSRFLLRTFAASSIVIALAMRYLFISSEWRRSIVLEAQSRISALQALIRPHFLFNSMNTIASLTRSDPGRAEEAVEDLADLFRATLSDAGRLLSLKEELELTRIYQRIEMLRLGERLSVEWDVAELPMRAQLPGLTLLENAIYHGIEPLDEGGTVLIRGRCDGTQVEIAVINPRQELNGDIGHRGHRIAIDNIRERLRLAFDGRGKLTVEQAPDSYSVTVSFPVT